MSEQHLLLDVPAWVGEQLHAWLAGNASADVRVAIPALTVSTTFTFDPKAFDGRQWTPTTSKAVSSMQQLPNAPGVQALVQELIAGKLEFTREQFNKFGTGMLPRGAFVEHGGAFFKPTDQKAFDHKEQFAFRAKLAGIIDKALLRQTITPADVRLALNSAPSFIPTNSLKEFVGAFSLAVSIRVPDATAAEAVVRTISGMSVVRLSADLGFALMSVAPLTTDDAGGPALTVNGVPLPASLSALPTVVETHASLDGITYYKTGEIGRVLVARHRRKEAEELAGGAASAEMRDGLAPATADIRRKMWRKRPARDEREVEQVAVELEALRTLSGRAHKIKPEEELIREEEDYWSTEEDPDALKQALVTRFKLGGGEQQQQRAAA